MSLFPLVAVAALLGVAGLILVLVRRGGSGEPRDLAPPAPPPPAPPHPSLAPSPSLPVAAPAPAGFGAAFAGVPVSAPRTPDALFTPAEATTARARMLLASDYDFTRLSKSIGQLSMSLEGAGPEVAPGEPAFATWVGGRSRVAYRYDPTTALRKLEVTGDRPDYLRNDLLNVLYLPTLEGYRVSELLASSEPRALLAGIAAADFIGVDGNEKYYEGRLAALRSHPDPAVAAAAARAWRPAPAPKEIDRAPIQAAVAAGHEGRFEGISTDMLNFLKGRQGRVDKKTFERVALEAHANVKALLAARFKHARFSGKTNRFKITGLVFDFVETTTDPKRGVRIATSNDGRYEYTLRPRELDHPSPPVYWYDLHADLATVGQARGVHPSLNR